jgi:hypothetical protein
MSEGRWVSEEAFCEAAGIDRSLPGKCCSGCHDEDDEGYGMCEIDSADYTKWASVCCAVATSAEAHDATVWAKL